MARELTIEVFASGIWQDAHSLRFEDALHCAARPSISRALPDLLVNLPDSVRNAKSIPLNNLDTHL